MILSGFMVVAPVDDPEIIAVVARWTTSLELRYLGAEVVAMEAGSATTG